MTDNKTKFIDIVKRDLKSKSSKAEREFLKEPENLKHWRNTLVDMHADIVAQRMQKNADLEEFRQECFSHGAIGKHRYFEAKAELQKWKADSNWELKDITRRLRDVKQFERENQPKPDEFSRRLHLLVRQARTLVPDTAEAWHDEYCSLFQNRRL